MDGCMPSEVSGGARAGQLPRKRRNPSPATTGGKPADAEPGIVGRLSRTRGVAPAQAPSLACQMIGSVGAAEPPAGSTVIATAFSPGWVDLVTNCG